MTNDEQTKLERINAAAKIIDENDPKAFYLHAEHDQLFLGSVSRNVTDDMRAKLAELLVYNDDGTWYMNCSA